jgi:hypothetical protein
MANLKKYLISLLAIVVLFIAQPASAANHKVSFSDASPELALGASVDLTMTLDQPIICDPSVACQVEIDFSSLPAGITVSPSTVTWLNSEWSQLRTITVAVDANATDLEGQTTNIVGQLTTNSSYYAPESPTIALSVPAVQVPDVVAYNQRGLSNTGSNTDSLFLVGSAFLISGIAVTTLVRKRARK